MAYNNVQSILQQILSQQGRQDLSPDEEYLLKLQQQQESQPPIEKVMMAQGPNPADMFAQNPGSTANALMNRRKMMEQSTQLLPDDIAAPTASVPPAGNAPAQQSVRGKQTPIQEEQLVRMLMGRGMSREEALARVRGM